MDAGYAKADRSKFADVFADGAFLAQYGIDNVITNISFAGLVLAVNDAGFAAAEAELSISPLPDVVLAQVRARSCAQGHGWDGLGCHGRKGGAWDGMALVRAWCWLALWRVSPQACVVPKGLQQRPRQCPARTRLGPSPPYHQPCRILHTALTHSTSPTTLYTVLTLAPPCACPAAHQGLHRRHPDHQKKHWVHNHVSAPLGWEQKP